ncbi:MAG: HK97 gp10 family phage protein [Chloroflexi bacterium]|nr:MAG: HK97 gp10 family phage protein [Chloroflexota bacterium]
MADVAEYRIDAKEMEVMQRALDHFPEIARPIAQTAMSDVVTTVAGNAKKAAPVDQGTLRGGIGGRVQTIGGGISALGGSIRGIVDVSGQASSYAPAQEYGRKPGTWPPIEPLIRWVHLHKLAGTYSVKGKHRRQGTWVSRGLEDLQIARAIQIKIFRKGMKGRFYFRQAMKGSAVYITARFRRCLSDIIKAIKEAKP